MPETTGNHAREAMSFDVVIVGGGPAGLAAAIRLKMLASGDGRELSVALLEKGAEIGAHIISGAVIDPDGLAALLPDPAESLPTEVGEERFLFLSRAGAKALPAWSMPPSMRHHGCRVGSLGDLCRRLGRRAEELGVEVYPGFAASDLVFGPDGAIAGVVAGCFGLGRDGKPAVQYQPGVELRARYTLFAEGARGSLSCRLIERFKLDARCQPQKYALGLKEIWRVPAQRSRPGLIQHTLGWPLVDPEAGKRASGGGFLYHYGDRLVSIGLVVHLDYANPWLSPYEEFQRGKHHPRIASHLEGGERIAYGARAIACGGWQSLPQLAFPGGLLLGCAAGLVNMASLQGVHNGVRSGLLAARSVNRALGEGRGNDALGCYDRAIRTGAVGRELRAARNVKPLLARHGVRFGAGLAGVDLWCRRLFGFSPFGTVKHVGDDAAGLSPSSACPRIDYPRPDGSLSFDRLTNLAHTGTGHREDQPTHLQLRDKALQERSEWKVYGGPSTRYCPAGVYEWLDDGQGGKKYRINAANCIHCKTCDIKDPNGNIVWTVPEGGGGPNYSGM